MTSSSISFHETHACGGVCRVPEPGPRHQFLSAGQGGKSTVSNEPFRLNTVLLCGGDLAGPGGAGGGEE